MTPVQVRAARGLLSWIVDRLSARSGTSYHVVRTFEQTGRIAPLHGRTQQVDVAAAIRATLEAAGIEFIRENGDGAGVRLRKPGQ